LRWSRHLSESLSRDIELTYLLRVSEAGGSSMIRIDGRCVNQSFFREHIERYRASSSLKQFTLRFVYEFDPEALGGFGG
jgi:hypothetical protein